MSGFTEVRKAAWRLGWMRWEDLTDLQRLLVKYETPAGLPHEQYDWLRDDEVEGGWLGGFGEISQAGGDDPFVRCR